MSERIDRILQMLSESGEDAFLRYSLGKEYLAKGRFAEAIEQFSLVIESDAGYLPAYVEAGKALRDAGDGEGARRMFAAALEVAAMKGETHVEDYVRDQLNALGQGG